VLQCGAAGAKRPGPRPRVLVCAAVMIKEEEGGVGRERDEEQERRRRDGGGGGGRGEPPPKHCSPKMALTLIKATMVFEKTSHNNESVDTRRHVFKYIQTQDSV